MSNNFNNLGEEHNALMPNFISNLNDEASSSPSAMSPDDYKEIFEGLSESVQTCVSSPPTISFFQ